MNFRVASLYSSYSNNVINNAKKEKRKNKQESYGAHTVATYLQEMLFK